MGAMGGVRQRPNASQAQEGQDKALRGEKRMTCKCDDCERERRREREEGKADTIRAMFPPIFKSGNLDTVKVGFEVGYWRKANQIHEWFVKNVQDGVDNCAYYYVGRDDLEKLLSLCKEALKSDHPEKVLPTQEGYFFGSTEYDEYYRDDLEDTVKILEKVLALPEEFSEFFYHSSW
jgi:hypothetical protein